MCLWSNEDLDREGLYGLNPKETTAERTDLEL
jgi:hypothetical protein